VDVPKKANPGAETVEKLAQALELDPVTLHRMVYRNKLDNLVGRDKLDQVMDVYDGIYALLLDSIEDLPEEKRPLSHCYSIALSRRLNRFSCLLPANST
jgi:hypothetical protein